MTIRKKRKFSLYNFFICSILLLWGFIIAFPFYNVIIISLKTRLDYVNHPLSFFPQKIVWDSYRYLFSSNVIFNGFKVSTIVVIFGVLYSMFLTVTLGYAISRPHFPGKKMFSSLIIFTMYFSGGLVPYYLIIKNLHLIDSIGGLIFPVGMNTFYLMIMITHFRNLPESIFEAARIDGANELYILRKIAIPISLPIIATLSLFYGVDRWNDWFLGMLVINNNAKYPIQLVLKTVLTDITTSMTSETANALQANGLIFSQSVKMACVVVTTLPVLMFYPFAQKYFVKGAMIGSIKS